MRILQIAPSFPDLQAGGTELCARSLNLALNRRKNTQSHLLACVPAWQLPAAPGTAFLSPTGRAHETGIAVAHFDQFYLSQPDSFGVLDAFRSFLVDYAPDEVHFHHLLYLGVEGVAIARRALPKARLRMTLHDYYPICPQDGVMTDKADGTPDLRTDRVSARRRYGGAVGLDKFALREATIKQAFGLIDEFVAPSRFLRDRYVDWGLPAAKIVHRPNALPEGWAEIAPLPARPRAEGMPVVFGFFGNVMPHKGVHLLLEAALLLKETGETGFRIAVYGGDRHAPEAYRTRLDGLAKQLGPLCTRFGAYRPEELYRLLADVDDVVVPSVWWENDPLIVRQAAAAGRPVLYADLGGLAEAGAQSGGLPFAARNPAALADLMRLRLRAVSAAAAA
ncbi:glycosyltransferase [Oceanibaculum pacificum]|uniref:Glycosyltransferase subfamily 4-like N-terminal domain-containing protein n=1 Tax=Oceanibaculum pacificum TaxID=580166 RepID=A0A154W2E7_9PROT|nr:glycosyltransferase [Oceanibaculum pacificum]KZD07802.1 hypothetical protein AUP43_09740 [Oceanibaculum pacificum]